MSERERWRKVRRADGYKVSSLGRIRGPGGPLTPFPDRDGYLRVTLRGEQVQMSHLVLEAFDRIRPYGLEACHGKAGNQVNHLTNVRWDTRRANGNDKKRKAISKSEWKTSPHRPKTTSQNDQQ
jgi:hypothetical protein